jgi:hypothetical protein
LNTKQISVKKKRERGKDKTKNSDSPTTLAQALILDIISSLTPSVIISYNYNS